jgi:uncharacterized protein (TIGR00725 family)
MRIGVIGPGFLGVGSEEENLAEQVGELLGRCGATIVCGGMGGVMAAACRGAQKTGATTVGLLPGFDTAAANPFLTVALPTGLGELRNGLIVNASQAIICIGGSWGTLSEVSLALRTGKPCVALRGWRIDTRADIHAEHLHHADTPDEAVTFAVAVAAQRQQPRPPGMPD